MTDIDRLLGLLAACRDAESVEKHLPQIAAERTDFNRHVADSEVWLKDQRAQLDAERRGLKLHAARAAKLTAEAAADRKTAGEELKQAQRAREGAEKMAGQNQKLQTELKKLAKQRAA